MRISVKCGAQRFTKKITFPHAHPMERKKKTILTPRFCTLVSAILLRKMFPRLSPRACIQLAIRIMKDTQSRFLFETLMNVHFYAMRERGLKDEDVCVLLLCDVTAIIRP